MIYLFYNCYGVNHNYYMINSDDNNNIHKIIRYSDGPTTGPK